MKSKGLQPRLFYTGRLSFKIKGEINSFWDKQKLKEFVTTKLVFQEMLKGLEEDREEGEGEREEKSSKKSKGIWS